MRLIFLDDSVQTDCPREGIGLLRALGCAIVPSEQISGYSSDLREIRHRFDLPEDEELKWKPKRGSELSKFNGERLTALRRAMLRAANDREVSTVVVAVDHAAAYTGMSDFQLGQRVLLKWIYERITYHLNDHGEVGIVVADKPGGGHKEESRWLADTLRLTNYGTEYVSASHVVMPILTADSSHIPHLQLADLVTAATLAAIAGRPSGLNLSRELYDLMHRNKLGTAGGAGLVLWPAHRNLMYWCFGESTWARPSAMVGLELPYPKWTYADHDGLKNGSTGAA